MTESMTVGELREALASFHPLDKVGIHVMGEGIFALESIEKCPSSDEFHLLLEGVEF